MKSNEVESDHFERIQTVVRESTLQLFEGEEFATLGPSIWATDACAPQDTNVFAVVGYAGESMRGTIILQATLETARHFLPAEFGPDATSDMICDQLGEIGNQVLGRIKNRLLAGGVVLNLATPTTGFGTRVRFGSSVGGFSRCHVLSWPKGDLVIRFDAQLAQGFVLGDVSAPSAEIAMPEGDMMLF